MVLSFPSIIESCWSVFARRFARDSMRTYTICGVLCLLLYGCQGSLPSTTALEALTPVASVPPPETKPTPPPKPKRVTNRPGNENGQVLVLEYHHITEKESRWARSRTNFLRDLQRLYKMGFRPVTLHEYLTNTFKVQPGATPVVFTFDDGHEDQFRMLADGTIDPNCMVGIWQKFAQTHKDFPVKATFYVLPNIPFAQKKFAHRKVGLLKRWGCELGIHTMSHHSLRTVSSDRVKKEIALSIEWLRKWGVNPTTMAMPYGEYPQDRSLVKKFRWTNGKIYSLEGAVRVGAVPNPPPTSDKIKRWGLPRIQGVDLDFGLTYWLAKIRAGKVSVYVEP